MRWSQIRDCVILFVLAAGAMLSPQNGAAQTPRPVQGSSVAEPAEANAKNALPIFEFHSNFWVSLHHFLYRQARLREQLRTNRSARIEGNAASLETNSIQPTTLSPEEQKAWTAALDYYARELAGRDLLFDGDMVLINNRLAELEACPDLSGQSSSACASGLRPQMVAALDGAAATYRAHWWAEHDGANRAWIAAVAPLVRRLGGPLAKQLATLYESNWPAGPIRVDVAAYAGPFGGYTSLDPLHITISSTDERNQGPAALEVLFHEASHALAGAVRDAIARECRAQSKPIPRDLWHALLFYTTGEVIQRALQAQGLSAPTSSERYLPYAYRNGLFARDWQGYQHLLERYWQPDLDGQMTVEAAVMHLVSAL